MGLFIILFFIVNPLVSIIIGIIFNYNIKKSWWILLLLAIIFPICYAIALEEIVFDLYIYSLGYFIIGIITIFICNILKNK